MSTINALRYLPPINQAMIDAVSQAAIKSISCVCNSPKPNSFSVHSIPSFLNKIVKKSQIQSSVLVCSMIYLKRVDSKLPKSAVGIESSRHRLLLASIILAEKFLVDDSTKNSVWASFADFIFSGAEVNLMERHLMMLLDYDLNIDHKEVEEYLAKFTKRSPLIQKALKNVSISADVTQSVLSAFSPSSQSKENVTLVSQNNKVKRSSSLNYPAPPIHLQEFQNPLRRFSTVGRNTHPRKNSMAIPGVVDHLRDVIISLDSQVVPDNPIFRERSMSIPIC